MQRDHLIIRRDFLAVICAGVLCSPSNGHTQAPSGPTVGFLDASSGTALKLSAFNDGLKTEGFVRNQNVNVIYHWAEGDYSRLRSLALDLKEHGVTILATVGVRAVQAAKAISGTIPLVFATVSDPVEYGLVANFDRPGGPITGVTTTPLDSVQFKFEIMRELMPAADSFALLVNPDNRIPDAEIQRFLSTAQRAGISIHTEYLNEERLLASCFARLSASKVQGLLIAADDFFESKSAMLGALSVQYSVATVFRHRSFVSAGGLAGFGGNPAETFHQLGAYVGLVLIGAQPPELPVYRVSRAECLLNAKTARLLKLTVPTSILNRAYDILQ